ncbi:MAG: hypothetical protein FWC72_03785 [Oscillospiraceae bacterium]|nr:hypothetical protein [Oscillospiraceae bacterium]
MIRKRYKFLGALLLLLLLLLTVSGCIPTPFVRGSPLVTGTWDGNTFTNQWTHITFELPAGFSALPRHARERGRVDDFSIRSEYPRIVIGMDYIDVAHGTASGYTAEYYLGIIQGSLLRSETRNFTFSEDFEYVTIAGREYTIMRGAYTYKDDPADGAFHDVYAHRFVNTMMILITVYEDGAADIVDAFLASIRN